MQSLYFSTSSSISFTKPYWPLRQRRLQVYLKQQLLTTSSSITTTTSKKKSTLLDHNNNNNNNNNKGKVLVIVESPAKAKTIQKFLNEQAAAAAATSSSSSSSSSSSTDESPSYIVDSCAGHIREISNEITNNTLVHTAFSLRLSDLGIDVFNQFKPVYKVINSKIEIVERLKEESEHASKIILATDEDREGEAISWHLIDVLKPTIPYERVVFHEITQSAIKNAFANPRSVDLNLVHAQEARSVLDKLAGFTLSPLLWRFVSAGLSAGRVQSCGLKLIAEREKLRWSFVSSQYHSLSALLTLPSSSSSSSSVNTIEAKLYSLNGLKVATERDFDGNTGEIRSSLTEKVHVLHGEECDHVMQWLSQDNNKVTFTIDQVQSKEIHKVPPPPYITSSLQQDGSRKLGLSPSRTMALAQTLYERGYITYMRTDSPTLSSNARQASIAMITELYGNNYLLSEKDGQHGNKGKNNNTPKNAQEAHEAIRPAEIEGRFRLPETLSSELAPEELRLYGMIFRRTLASQMTSSLSLSATVTIQACSDNNSNSGSNTEKQWQEATFRCSETSIVFPGYLRALSSRYSSGEAEKNLLHSLCKGQKLSLSKDSTWTKSSTTMNQSSLTETVGEAGEVEEVVEGSGGMSATGVEALAEEEEEEGAVSLSMPGLRSVSHDTRPPSRFTEASFIRELEKIGVGRPSTYSYILSVLRDRDYVLVDKQSLIPTVRGLLVASFLSEHFSSFVSEAFTAQMEELLDGVAKGEVEKATFLQSFYFGDDDKKKNMMESKEDELADDEEVKQTQTTKKKGLLTAVVELLEDEKIDRRDTRCLTLSYLSDLGKLRLSRNGVLFEKHSITTAAAGDTTITSSSSSVSDSTDEASDLVWKLPLDMERDLREITREKITEILTSQPSLQGRSLGIHPETNESISLRSGRFGKYLELRESQQPQLIDENQQNTKSGRQKKAVVRTMSVPSWLTEDTPLEDVLELMTLPKVLGNHPENEEEIISLELFSGDLCVVVRGEESLSQASILTPISLKHFTLDDALHVIQEAQRNTDSKEGKSLLRKQVISSSDLRELGEWEGKKVSIQLGRFGLYLRSGNIVAGLGKFDAKSITLEDAITILTRKQARKTKMSSAKKAKKTKATAVTTKTAKVSKSPAASAASGVLKAKKATSTTKKTKAVKSTTGATKSTTSRKKKATATTTTSEEETTASLTLNDDDVGEEEGKVVIGRKKSKVGVRRSAKKSESLIDGEEPIVTPDTVVEVKKPKRTKASTTKTTKTKVTRRKTSKVSSVNAAEEVDGEHVVGVEQKEDKEEQEVQSGGKRRSTKSSAITTPSTSSSS
eukprot:scaffold98_cov248-Ochromonas_danica.AAC.22